MWYYWTKNTYLHCREKWYPSKIQEWEFCVMKRTMDGWAGCYRLYLQSEHLGGRGEGWVQSLSSSAKEQV